MIMKIYHMWRSIQDVVKQGCWKRIGNGDSTKVWKVPSLPCPENGFLTTNIPEELENIMVRNLMVGGENKWDDEVLKDICNARNVELYREFQYLWVIYKILGFDFLMMRGLSQWRSAIVNCKENSWRLTLVFTVKSCYRKRQGEFVMPYPSF